MLEDEDITTVHELIILLQSMPQDLPVLVSGYKNGFENFYHPRIAKMDDSPENMYMYGAYQNAEKKEGLEVVIRQRILRTD